MISQEAIKPKHIHEEYEEHLWQKTKLGGNNLFAFEYKNHHGPACLRCCYSFCLVCDPDGWNKRRCIVDEDRCPSCYKLLHRDYKYCPECGQRIDWQK